jgi:hypothetical protein
MEYASIILQIIYLAGIKFVAHVYPPLQLPALFVHLCIEWLKSKPNAYCTTHRLAFSPSNV